MANLKRMLKKQRNNKKAFHKALLFIDVADKDQINCLAQKILL